MLRPYGKRMPTISISFTLNGSPVTIEIDPTHRPLDPGGLEPFERCGATQCGACTPGVVMAAWWIREHPELLGTHTVRELMAGNLCRCTGYDGIIDSVAEALRETGSGKRET